MSERSQLAAEMHTRLVSHLEERLAGGEIDPDLLAAADPAACQAHIELQERWMTSALPDGRVPMDVLPDEKDEELFAGWDAADADALAAGVVSPQGPEPWEGPAQDGPEGAESELAATCAIDHFDWLAAITALAEGGAGTAASAADLAAYVRDYDPGEPGDPDEGGLGEEDGPDSFLLSDDDDEFDDLTMEGLFLPVTSLWQVLGAIDEDERLTALGWWGLPEAMLRVWPVSENPHRGFDKRKYA